MNDLTWMAISMTLIVLFSLITVCDYTFLPSDIKYSLTLNSTAANDISAIIIIDIVKLRMLRVLGVFFLSNACLNSCTCLLKADSFML